MKVHDRSQSLLNDYGFALTNDEQIDWLTGNGGSDVFVLGEITGKVFYSETGNGYAVIQDWDPKLSNTDAQFDQIQLASTASQYKLNFTSVSGIGSSAKDTEIFVNSNGKWGLYKCLCQRSEMRSNELLNLRHSNYDFST